MGNREEIQEVKMRDYDLPGIGDYDEPEYEESYEDYLEGWYMFNEDRSDGWDDVD